MLNIRRFYKRRALLNLVLNSLLLLFIFTSTNAQNIDSLILSRVNLFRDSLNVPNLKEDQILVAAAKNQTYYNASHRSLSHFQKTFGLETPKERVLFYSGKRTYVTEYLCQFNINQIKNNPEALILKVDSLILNWITHSQTINLMNPILEKIGVSSFTLKKNGKVYVALVSASVENELPKYFNNSKLSWGVRPIEKTCKDQSQTYQTLYFANSVEKRRGDIYFNFHDIRFFNNVIANDNDGLAIDIVLREQLPCGRENQFHPSEIFDGEMQRPIYKYDIHRTNESSNPRKISVKIGSVPDYLKEQQWDANIIIINNNKLCDYSIPVEIPSAIYPLLPIRPYYDSIIEEDSVLLNTKVHIQDSVHITAMYQRNEEMFSAFDESLYQKFVSWGAFCKSASVVCNASVEGALWRNEELLKERRRAIIEVFNLLDFDTTKIDVVIQENWGLMSKQIREFDLMDIADKSKSQIKSYLKRNKSMLYDSLLFEQRKTHIYASIDTLIDVKGVRDYNLALFYKPDLSLSALPWNTILKEEYILKDIKLPIYIFDSLRNEQSYKTNLLGAACIGDNQSDLDSLMTKDFLRGVDLKNPKQLFNYSYFLTKYWFSNYSRRYKTEGVAITTDPETLLDFISGLDTIKIKKLDLIKLNINVLLSGIHYYVAHNEWNYTELYIDKITELALINEITPQEAIELALFFNHFHKFKNTVDLLERYQMTETLPEDGYFVLAKTATLIRQELDNERYYSFMKSAKDSNKKRYCSWLDNEFQIQRDEFLKREFCNECR